MKIKFESKVESKTKIEKTIIGYNDKVYEFLPNEEGFFSKITITGTAPNPEKFSTGFSQLPNHKKNSLIYFNIDHDFKDEIVEELQCIEGLFSFGANLRRIRWDDLLIEMIPETPEEKGQIKLNKFGFRPEIIDDPKEFSPNDIGQILIRSRLFSGLSVYFAFFKEGSNDFLTRRFINAFYNFYFILEALYGNNKWRNYEVRQEFEKAQELIRIIRRFLKELKKAEPHEYKKLADQVKAMKDPKGNPVGKRMGAKGIIHFIVDTRGDVHHFSMYDTRQHGSPFKQEDYYPISHLLRAAAGETLQLLMEYFEKQYFKDLKKQSKKALVDNSSMPKK